MKLSVDFQNLWEQGDDYMIILGTGLDLEIGVLNFTVCNFCLSIYWGN